MSYCASRFHTIRRRSVEVRVGPVGVGGANPVRVQSMTTSDTQDIDATVRQSIALAEVGCEIVRVTAPNVAAAKCLKDIREQFSAAGFSNVPLVADIHFLPSAAMEAVEHVEKVRVNPGNYADKKKFAVREYSDADYDLELERLHEAFSPLVLRCKELGRALRIGTNHGSLSDRIMNRHGDTPLGMVESALEFVRIAESHGFHDIILSMKSSNPKVMIQAYRLLVQRMDAAHRPYPLHLGVTEAGDGEDGRIKGAIGIGSLLMDGLGDTIRVSLTEDSVYEIPVARALVERAASAEAQSVGAPGAAPDSIDPYHYHRRETVTVRLSTKTIAGGGEPPRVIVRLPSEISTPTQLKALLASIARTHKDTPIEGLIVRAGSQETLRDAVKLAPVAAEAGAAFVFEVGGLGSHEIREAAIAAGAIVSLDFADGESAELEAFARAAREGGWTLAVGIDPADFHGVAASLQALGDENLIFALHSGGPAAGDAIAPTELGAHRQLLECLRAIGSRAPVWIRNRGTSGKAASVTFLQQLLDASILTGGLLCDGLGDLVSIETEPDAARACTLTYNVLQGAGARISKTEFVACPSCGRTLFDLQSTTQRIRSRTRHLKGVKIAIMGCIVNGPGEMADADFGYVGGAPGKINLYVGKNCVRYNIPEAEADDRLVDLIREHGRWTEPDRGDAVTHSRGAVA
ncbi:MAG TPA: (E)-4-hydroxy-3-methylbut-2-enyl-diphosphate synthase [Opitutaceae bacterium]|nr:(E)-4-hydroxy-3-methylbut-2-enyl-diphosphate synthase [Opitutaceae bacterium]